MSHYRLHGIDGLRPKRSVYCAQFKLEGPCQQDRDQLLSRQVAAIYDTFDSNQVMAWRHTFDTGGMAAPESRKQGRPNMKQTRCRPVPQRTNTTDSAHALCEENERLSGQVT